ncbi:MAG: flagellar assembly protein FliW [Bacteroidales bacterium]|nr:flagellar assembly protein FliW [Candidatus Latescibacterota bacterium]
MKIKSSIFDEIEFDEKDIIVLDNGLIGIETLSRFILMDFADESAFHWLQSVDDPDMGFIVSEPTIFDGEYTFAIDPGLKEILSIEKDDDVVVMSIVTIRDHGNTITGNLLGPVVINASKRIGIQIVLDSDDYSSVTPLRKIEEEKTENESKVGCMA